MDKVNGLDLQEILISTVSDTLEERRRSVAGLVKQMLQAREQIATEVKQLEKALEGKQKKASEMDAKLARLRDGDWGVLQEKKADQKQNPLQTEGE